MNISLVQMNSGTDVSSNTSSACKHIRSAVEHDSADLVVLPEFFNNFYFAQYRDMGLFKLAEPDDGPTITSIRESAQRNHVNVIATIYEFESPGIYYDTAIIIDRDGEIIGKYRKVHPAAVQSLEKIYFRYGSQFPTFIIDGWRVGVVICYDTLFAESARCAALAGAEIVVIPFAAPGQHLWRELMRTRAFENGVYLAPCNKVGVEGMGTEGDWRFGGRSMIVDPFGEVLSELGTDEVGITSATVSHDCVREARIRYPMLRDRRPDLYGNICSPTEDLMF